MFKNIKKTLQVIKKTVGYDPQKNVGKFGSSGNHIDDQELQNEPNGYEANQNVPNVHPDGGMNTDLDSRNTMKDIQDFHTNAVQELLGNPKTVRPVKNNFRNIDRELENQYFSNMEAR